MKRSVVRILQRGAPAALVSLLTAGAAYGAVATIFRNPLGMIGFWSVLRIAILAIPFTVGLLSKRWWMALAPPLGFVLAVALVLARTHEGWSLIRGLVLPYWMAMGWGGMAVGYAAGSGVRYIRSRSAAARTS